MEPYLRLFSDTNPEMAKFIRDITRKREQDVDDFTALPNEFIQGRKVNKIPSSSIDVESSDHVGDVNYTSSYFYILIDNSGTAEWRRISLGSW